MEHNQENNQDRDQLKSSNQQRSSNIKNQNGQEGKQMDIDHYDDQEYPKENERLEKWDFIFNDEEKHTTPIQSQIDYVKTLGGKQNFQINQQQLLLFKNICLLNQKRSKMNQKQQQQIHDTSDNTNQEINQDLKTIDSNDFITDPSKFTQQLKIPTWQNKFFSQKFLEQQKISNFLPKILQRSIY